MIDIVIPTMWRSKTFIDCLSKYVANQHIGKIILVDNDRRKRPKHPILDNAKIELVDYGKNIYVNPSWNEGYYRATTEVFGIINDDITIEDSLFEDITKIDFSAIDLVGVHLQGTVDNYNITDHLDKKDRLFKLDVNKEEAIGGQSYAFGVCMFVKRSSYSIIPSLYQIWFGDDYLVQKAKNIYCLKTSRIKGEISKTLVSLEGNKEISDRIVLDCVNAANHGHLKNSRNWDLVRQTVDRSKMKFQATPDNIFANEYKSAIETPSDINQNLPILHNLAKECNHITEMGVRSGVSTRAFLNTSATLHSYDIVLNPDVAKLFEVAKKQGKKVEYTRADVLAIEIQETDLLFIDTLHTYGQLKMELALHGNKSRRWLAFHDTYTFGLNGETRTDKKGLLTAIIEFMVDNPHWVFKIHNTNNNGITVLERIDNGKI
jgi:hypothetical protein